MDCCGFAGRRAGHRRVLRHRDHRAVAGSPRRGSPRDRERAGSGGRCAPKRGNETGLPTPVSISAARSNCSRSGWRKDCARTSLSSIRPVRAAAKRICCVQSSAPNPRGWFTSPAIRPLWPKIVKYSRTAVSASSGSSRSTCSRRRYMWSAVCRSLGNNTSLAAFTCLKSPIL